MTTEGAIHELGHVFDNQFNSFAGEFWASNYLPTHTREITGYKGNDFPYVGHSWIHEGGDKMIEEFADMYQNWVLHDLPDYPRSGFTSDVPAAYSPWDRYSYMNYQMTNIWLPTMGMVIR
ncbi:MAG: hypothetical protein HN741_09050 [Anaerolineae bacterium]|nr:hypothetical protein [Anaerolineae bacterium]